MSSSLQDLRLALRQIRRSPVFFASAVLLIAACIAVNTEVFSLIDAVILRRLPVSDPDRLVQLFEIHPRILARFYFEYGLLRDLREHSATLTDVVGQMEMKAPLSWRGTVERVIPHRVTDDYFRTLGVLPALGRVFREGDEQVTVLSAGYWKRAFGADPKVLGQPALYDRRRCAGIVWRHRRR
jgi:putative ABC transport system permease protein